MKKIITAFTILLALTGCVKHQHKPNTASVVSNFSWATADFRKIENKVYKIVERNNPYPDTNVDKREVQAERSQISRRINSIKNEICSLSKTKKNTGRYNQDCYSKSENDPRVIALQKEKQKVEKLSRKIYAHSDKIRAFAKEKTSDIIKRYGEGKFDVVVRQGRDNVVFNKRGVALDITDALMQQIDETKLIMNH